MANVDIENPSTLVVRHPRQTVHQSSQISLISSALTSIKARRSHFQCHLLIITRSLWLLVQCNVISCEKEARGYTIIDHIPQYPSISKTTETCIIRVTCPAYFHLPWNFSIFVPRTPASIDSTPQPQNYMSMKRNAGEMLTQSFLLPCIVESSIEDLGNGPTNTKRPE